MTSVPSANHLFWSSDAFFFEKRLFILLPDLDAWKDDLGQLVLGPNGCLGWEEAGHLRLHAWSREIDRKHLQDEEEKTYCEDDTSCCSHRRSREDGMHGVSVLWGHGSVMAYVS